MEDARVRNIMGYEISSFTSFAGSHNVLGDIFAKIFFDNSVKEIFDGMGKTLLHYMMDWHHITERT